MSDAKISRARSDEILGAIADVLADGRFLDREFLVEHNLSSKETLILDHVLPQIIRGFLRSPQIEQESIIMRGMVENEEWDDIKPVLEIAIMSLQMTALSETLKSLK